MQLHELIGGLAALPSYPWRVERGKLLSQDGQVLAENVDSAIVEFLSTCPTVMHQLIEESTRVKAINRRLVNEQRSGHWERERTSRA